MSALLSCKMPSKYYGICAEKILKQSDSLDWLTGLPRIGELWKMYFECWNEVLEVIEMGRNSRSLGEILASRGTLTWIWFWLHRAVLERHRTWQPNAAQEGSNICGHRTRNAAARDGESDATSGRLLLLASTPRGKLPSPLMHLY